ncbi:MAG: glycogen debranching protein GlgX [Treponema sp.]|nr:glycogen debranching protein GlgX [Treponema sp.]
MSELIVQNGYPLQSGATLMDGGVNFAVYSRNATRMVIYFFEKADDKLPSESYEFDPEKNKTGDIWHCFIKGKGEGTLYLYRADGPYNPPKGHRFNFTKYLLDPYAKALTTGSVFRSYNKQRELGLAGVQNGELQDLSDFPKCVVVDDKSFDWAGDKPLNYPLNETVIYETHVKGFTASETSGLSAEDGRGTYKGFQKKIDYLKNLGITSVEFLPLFEFDENENGNENPRTGEKLVNYWGYSTMGFFAPKTSYAFDKTPGGSVREFKELVKALHKAGIEVILDVVFNHTAEGNEHGYTFCFRGFENSVYYSLPVGEQQYYMNYSGCGNTVNCNHPVVRRFIIECLRYWVMEMHVDGFRFDLASILTREANGHIPSNPPLTNEISEDPVLRNTKIIAEPWDCGGAYQVGGFPGGRWSEWNGKFRDDIRRFIRGDDFASTQAATRVAGSSDLYNHDGRSPLCSVNFITAHDGFTLNDLVSYNYKHNEENGEENRDGTDDNVSWNHGYEGDTVNPKIENLRIKKIKNFMLYLMTSQGVPMMLGGDEMRRTQNGNNNTYCQDSQLNWFDWTLAEKNAGLVRFTKELIALRKNNGCFRRTDFFPDTFEKGTAPEITWYDRNGKNPEWGKMDRFLSYKLSGEKSDFYIATNMDIYDLTITLPTLPAGKNWYRVADTSFESPADFCEAGTEELLMDQKRYVLITGSSTILMSK